MADHSDLPDVPEASGAVSTVSVDDVTEAAACEIEQPTASYDTSEITPSAT